MRVFTMLPAALYIVKQLLASNGAATRIVNSSLKGLGDEVLEVPFKSGPGFVPVMSEVLYTWNPPAPSAR